MHASPDLAGGSGAAGAFVTRLRCLTHDELAAVVRRVGGTRATAADDLDLCRATVAVSVELRRLHRWRAAAIASLQACEAVLDAPGATEVPHAPVVRAARAAGDFARTTTCPVGGTLAVGASCSISVTFAPTTSSVRSALMWSAV